MKTPQTSAGKSRQAFRHTEVADVCAHTTINLPNQICAKQACFHRRQITAFPTAQAAVRGRLRLMLGDP